MAISAVNLDEVRHFTEEIRKVREKLKTDTSYRNKVLRQGKEYTGIKYFFQKLVRFLKYTNTVEIDSCYRIRKSEHNEPFVTRKDVIYPEPSLEHEDRMNNTSFRVLYTSMHEFTAMAEIRLGKSFINNNFQLTRFLINKKLSIFKLGMFSELHLNSPRNSQFVKNEMLRLLGPGHHNSTLRGFSALESLIADVLYDQNDGYHILSSIVADAIFSENEGIDAILYPSMQNRYGMNLAIKKEVADTLSVSYTSLNKLIDVYDNGFYKYRTIKSSIDCSNPDLFEFEDVEEHCCYR